MDELDEDIRIAVVSEAITEAKGRKEKASRYLDEKIREGLKDKIFIKTLSLRPQRT